MTEQTNSGAPGGTPGGDAPGNTGGSFVRDRTVQMLDKMQGARPSQGEQPTEPAADQRQQQQAPPPAAQKIRIGDAEYEPQAVSDALAAKAEQDIRRQNLPKAETDYQVRNSENFKLPDGISFEFDQADETLAAAKKFALDRGLDQQTFSGMLDLFVASKSKELLGQAQARQRNLDALGAAGPARITAVATWLKATAGAEGAAVANFISQYPSAPIVKAVETLIRRFTNQGGADFSQQHRAQEEPAGTIPGYENMSFQQRRVAQMQTRMATERDYGRAPTTPRGGDRR